MSDTTHIGAALQSEDGFWAKYPKGHEKEGRAIRRKVDCLGCGAKYMQFKLSERFLRVARFWAEKSGRVAAIDREIPDGWAPLYCPKCERRRLARSADVSFREEDWAA